jgi:hypothetical protein
VPGKAPPVAKGVTYERILNARSEPQIWLTYRRRDRRSRAMVLHARPLRHILSDVSVTNLGYRLVSGCYG